MRRRKHRTTGQAIVEFALAATLIFFLLSAAVDLGLLFFSLQAVRVAAQEGATFGRVPVQFPATGAIQAVELDYDQIIARIRGANGETAANSRKSVGLVNLYDLNNNGTDDVAEGVVWNPATQRRTMLNENNWLIRVDNPRAATATAAQPLGAVPQCRTTTPGADMRDLGFQCWVRVEVKYTYKFFFPIAPVFGNTVTFPVTYMIEVKSTFAG